MAIFFTAMELNKAVVVLLSLLLHYAFLKVLSAARFNERTLDHFIQKRNLREDGFTNFLSVSFEMIRRGDNINTHQSIGVRHVRDTRASPSESLEMHIYNDDRKLFELELQHTRSVFHPDGEVWIRNNDKTELWEGGLPDCFMVGRVKNSPDDAGIFSYCNGMKGTFHHDNFSYWLEHLDTVDQETDQRQQKLILARKGSTNSNEQYKKPVAYHQAAERPQRRTRAVGDTITIETVGVVDALYNTKMKATGLTSIPDKLELMGLKFSGVQAEWSKSDVLGYTVFIVIKRFEFWETDPAWYSTYTTLEYTLESICFGAHNNGLYTEYDHIHLFTGITGTDVAGKAFTSKICDPLQKCAVATLTSFEEYVTSAHELGHCMGMHHDSDVGCPAPNDGIMGSKSSGWSNCSVNSMQTLLSGGTAHCLYTTDVNASSLIPQNPVWPGMIYSDDEVCAFKYGPGYRFRSYPMPEWGQCSIHSCVYMNSSSLWNGISNNDATPISGRHCGDQQVCSVTSVNGGFPCIFLNETGLNVTNLIEVVGGWSDWSSVTTCSRTCGGGVQYRERTCTNPKPRISGSCQGNEYDATICNPEACTGDSKDQATLINQRAGEICAYWKTNGLYERMGFNSSNFLNTGSKRSEIIHGQCEVVCDRIAGYVTSTFQRYGLMPDGTPCSHASLSSFVEVNKLPRRSGKFGTCVQGYCYLFGSNNQTDESQIDGCGVSGGNNSTCKIVEGIYNTILNNNQRGTIVVVPARAFMIQFYCTYSTMQSHYIELRTVQNIGVIVNPTLDTKANPFYFAGAFWYFDFSKQFLYAEGTTDQAVLVKLWKISGTANNTGVYYGYSTPLTDCATGSCEFGVWNTSTCSCDCTTGHYGLTCSTTCNKYCRNGQSPQVGACVCNCTGRTYLYSNATCSCRYPFTGKLCQDCKVTTCLNGGIFNVTSCRCKCPAGFGSLDCSTTCQDYNVSYCGSNATCDTNNEVMEQNCYKTCGHCDPATPTTSTAPASSTSSVSTASVKTTAFTASAASTTTSTATTSSTSSVSTASVKTTAFTASSASTTTSTATASSTSSVSTASVKTTASTASTKSTTLTSTMNVNGTIVCKPQGCNGAVQRGRSVSAHLFYVTFLIILKRT